MHTFGGSRGPPSIVSLLVLCCALAGSPAGVRVCLSGTAAPVVYTCAGGGARVALAILHSPVLHDPGIDSVWHLTWPRATTLSTSG